MKNSFMVLALIGFACGRAPEIPDFDAEQWRNAPICSPYRISGASILEANEQLLQGAIQKDIEYLLGTAHRHELADRSEKFFIYPITFDCPDLSINTSLSIRFDALGRVKEALIILED